jgi:hypothetical protein
MGFERAENDQGQKLSWRANPHRTWGAMVLELLADKPEIAGGKVQSLLTEGRSSALNVPHSSIVFETAAGIIVSWFPSWHVAVHLSRGLVVAQTLIDHLAQQIVLGPGQKLDLRDELGTDPMQAAQDEG